MTSFRLSELPTPYRSTGASPLGTHEGTVTPPEPPVPPTPTGKVYFSGTSVEGGEQGGIYVYTFDPSGGSYVDEFAAKQIGDEVVVTANGTTQTVAITSREEYDLPDQSLVVEMAIGEVAEEVPLLLANSTLVGDAWSFENIAYISLEEIPDGVTLTIADPA